MKLKSIMFFVLAASCVPAGGFINPDFTPVHLCREADGIYLVAFSPAGEDGKAAAKIETTFKGKADADCCTFDLLAGAFETKGRKVMKMIAGEHRQALLFTGAFQAGSEDMEIDEDLLAKALLHVGKDWVVLSCYEPGLWEMDDIDARLLGTWAGSTEMLTGAVKYILSDADADVPVNSGVRWSKPVKLAQVSGEVTGIRPVDTTGNGKAALHVSCKAGDRLIFRKADKFDSVPLAAKSLNTAWADLDGNGRVDLASWGEGGLTVNLQQADGSFKGKLVNLSDVLKGKCLSLDATDSGQGRAALLAGTDCGPVLIAFAEGLKPEAKLLAGKSPSGKDAGKASQCVVADLDGDAVTDVLQFFENGGMFYKGKPDGSFQTPAKVHVAAGKAPSSLSVGDFDMDGMLDVIACAADGNRMWRNLGAGKFVEMLAMSGEIEYISRAGAIGAWAGDVNNDGRQDLLMIYPEGTPQVFFNRGFHSFGHARMLDVVEGKRLPAAAKGQQAACLSDLNADGALDLVLALKDGSIWMLPRQVSDGALSACVAISPDLKRSGPVTVTGRQEERCFGAYPLRAGDPGVLFGLREPGPVAVAWKLPGGKRECDEVFLEAGPVRILLGKKN